MASFSVLLAIATVCSFLFGSAGGLCKSYVDPSKWKVVFKDEFEGSQLDDRSWTARNNMTHGAREYELYMADEAYVQAGYLVLRTRKRRMAYGSKVYNYTSGWVDSRDKVAYKQGRFEVCAKLPAGQGYWPAHWLMPDDSVCWPDGGEIDIMEQFYKKNEYNGIVGTYHWGHSCSVDQWDGGHGVYPNATQPKVDFNNELHVFAIEWNTTAISWFMNSHLYYTRRAGTPPTLFIPNRPFHVILNTALDWWSPPDDTTPFPGYHMIDYVTIYQSK